MVDQLELGTLVKRDVTLMRSAPGPGPQTLIGMDVLRDFACHFLFDERRLSLAPSVTTPHSAAAAGGCQISSVCARGMRGRDRQRRLGYRSQPHHR